jgi:hypothetical protein
MRMELSDCIDVLLTVVTSSPLVVISPLLTANSELPAFILKIVEGIFIF